MSPDICFAGFSSAFSRVTDFFPRLQDNTLREAVKQYGAKNWKQIAECVPGRTDVQCLHRSVSHYLLVGPHTLGLVSLVRWSSSGRWQKVLNPELVKGPWTKEEDELVVKLVQQYGPKRWSLIASHLKVFIIIIIIYLFIEVHFKLF